MLSIRHAVKLHHRDAPIASLLDRTDEICEFPRRSCVTSGRDQQRVVETRFIGKAVAVFVWMLGGAAASSESNAEFAQACQCLRCRSVAGIGKACRDWYAILFTLLIDGFQLFG